ncbi:FecR domain-containing protein [Fulvivirgaceae bacterium BMA12]|uniref:FecR domain-containing protein n=1 Tax=Agaribacillus aureus TaxID=3051825 RepID=A0ABT8L987_9BACT|nr:FecR domain-containing protein [Fulvivirgaceae bacterium BMA12]
MKRKKHLNYSLADLLKDDYFHKWIIDNDPECNEFWENWMKEDATRPGLVSKAKTILSGIEFKADPMPGEIKARLWKQLESEVIVSKKKRRHFFRPLKIRSYHIAATVVLMAVAFFTFYYMQPASIFIEDQPITYIEKVCLPGQKITVPLEDGSKVKLNAGSTLRFPSAFSRNAREVYLEGEAFFEVRKDPDRQFKVNTSNITVSVLGTSFNVSAYAENKDVSVAVLTGEVMVSSTTHPAGNRVNLQPREMAVYHKDDHITTKGLFDYEEVLDWKDGVLNFDNASFEEIVVKLEKWFGVTFDIRREIVTEKDFSGRFKDKSLEYILQGLSFSFDFEYQIAGEQIIIK